MENMLMFFLLASSKNYCQQLTKDILLKELQKENSQSRPKWHFTSASTNQGMIYMIAKNYVFTFFTKCEGLHI